MSGEDCNAYDDSGCSALHAAIVESHFDVVDLLILNGSNVDSRDKNMMTPMLSCVGRGLLDGVRHLINHGADKTVSDRIHRNALYFAVKSGSLGMIRQFINPESCNQHDSLWGWTPLHCAANKGDMKVVKLLLDFGASIFMFSKVSLLLLIDSYNVDCLQYFYQTFSLFDNVERENSRGCGQRCRARGSSTIFGTPPAYGSCSTCIHD